MYSVLKDLDLRVAEIEDVVASVIECRRSAYTYNELKYEFTKATERSDYLEAELIYAEQKVRNSSLSRRAWCDLLLTEYYSSLA